MTNLLSLNRTIHASVTEGLKNNWALIFNIGHARWKISSEDFDELKEEMKRRELHVFSKKDMDEKLDKLLVKSKSKYQYRRFLAEAGAFETLVYAGEEWAWKNDP